MEAIFAQAIKDTAVLRKSSVPWKLDNPHPQSYYAFDPSTSSWTPKPPSQTQEPTDITKIAVYSWNIDFMLPFAEARMKPALAHLNRLTTALPATTAPVIFLQECTPSDLTTIASTPWIQAHFHITDLDHKTWSTTHYGTTALIDSRLPIISAFRIHYSKTRMDRDALFVDIFLGLDAKRIRLCTTHLESMAFDPPFRPLQMQLAAGYLRQESVYAALAAGDFNAIQPFDRTLHVDNDLKDAFLEIGGKEDSEEGFTWGQQAATNLREQFGCSRMDKVYFCGGVKLIRFERFGEGVLLDEEGEESERIVELGFEKPWVTDHLGVVAEVEVQV
ncbi:Endonuclease/exonuclease/phosphatase [Aspergillus cavernicola]|uniref:Endonuclease/exonuclease/phosphatase n=1 Tax=Aspergillus cavernicola TaxID=176166 RepID=A0ABR4I298_9EURO